jgi:hypothetical protein
MTEEKNTYYMPFTVVKRMVVLGGEKSPLERIEAGHEIVEGFTLLLSIGLGRGRVADDNGGLDHGSSGSSRFQGLKIVEIILCALEEFIGPGDGEGGGGDPVDLVGVGDLGEVGLYEGRGRRQCVQFIRDLGERM